MPARSRSRLLKAPPIVFDLALIAAVFFAASALTAQFVPRGRSRALALGAAAAIAFHPAVVYESAVWAQVDAAITAAMVAAVVLAARERPGWAGASWGLGFAIKPQPIVIVPVLLVLVLRREGWRGTLRWAAGAAASFGAIILPWLLHGDGHSIYDVYQRVFTSAQYSDRLSAGAWNTWWFWVVGSHPLPGDKMFAGLGFLTYKRAGLGLSAMAIVVALAYTWRRPTLAGGLIAAAYMAFAFYMLPTSSHERYLYPFLGLLLPVAIARRRWLWLYVPASITFTANLLVVAPPVHSWAGRWTGRRSASRARRRTSSCSWRSRRYWRQGRCRRGCAGYRRCGGRRRVSRAGTRWSRSIPAFDCTEAQHSVSQSAGSRLAGVGSRVCRP